jgi:hypothetical protein
MRRGLDSSARNEPEVRVAITRGLTEISPYRGLVMNRDADSLVTRQRITPLRVREIALRFDHVVHALMSLISIDRGPA